MNDRAPRLADLTTVEASTLAGSVLLVPLGSTEQHGPHLPLGTDTVIAVAVAERAAAHCPRTVVGPALPYGSSGEHAGFAGTTSTGHAALEHLLVELVRSVSEWVGRVVLVCAHGGNHEPVARAVTTLRSEGRDVAAWFCRVPGGDAHAGRTETSLLLAIDSGAVRRHKAEPGATEELGVLMGRLRSDGVAAVSPNGVLGDPTLASPEEGRALLARLVADLTAFLTKAPT